jgi:lantibiotic transport system permease protein
MNLLISLRSEILKTKRTPAFYLTLVAAAFAPFMSMLELIFEGVHVEEKDVILNKMFTVKYQITGFLVFPFFLMLICTLLPQTEYKNNTWKQVLASPQTRSNVFLAKFINVQILIVVFLVTYELMMFADAVILHFMEPSLHVLSQPVDVPKVLSTLATSYVALFAICTIQFWLGLRFKNFIIPIAIGIACWFAGTILIQMKSGLVSWFPYSFHVYGNIPEFEPKGNTIGWVSLLYAALFLVIGFLEFRKRKVSA